MGTDRTTKGVVIPVRIGSRISSTGSKFHRASSLEGFGGPFFVIKMAGHETDHSPSTNAEVKRTRIDAIIGVVLN
jgi:hypothetical protein